MKKTQKPSKVGREVDSSALRTNQTRLFERGPAKQGKGAARPRAQPKAKEREMAIDPQMESLMESTWNTVQQKEDELTKMMETVCKEMLQDMGLGNRAAMRKTQQVMGLCTDIGSLSVPENMMMNGPEKSAKELADKEAELFKVARTLLVDVHGEAVVKAGEDASDYATAESCGRRAWQHAMEETKERVSSPQDLEKLAPLDIGMKPAKRKRAPVGRSASPMVGLLDSDEEQEEEVKRPAKQAKQAKSGGWLSFLWSPWSQATDEEEDSRQRDVMRRMTEDELEASLDDSMEKSSASTYYITGCLARATGLAKAVDTLDGMFGDGNGRTYKLRHFVREALTQAGDYKFDSTKYTSLYEEYYSWDRPYRFPDGSVRLLTLSDLDSLSYSEVKWKSDAAVNLLGMLANGLITNINHNEFSTYTEGKPFTKEDLEDFLKKTGQEGRNLEDTIAAGNRARLAQAMLQKKTYFSSNANAAMADSMIKAGYSQEAAVLMADAQVLGTNRAIRKMSPAELTSGPGKAFLEASTARNQKVFDALNINHPETLNPGLSTVLDIDPDVASSLARDVAKTLDDPRSLGVNVAGPLFEVMLNIAHVGANAGHKSAEDAKKMADGINEARKMVPGLMEGIGEWSGLATKLVTFFTVNLGFDYAAVRQILLMLPSVGAGSSQMFSAALNSCMEYAATMWGVQQVRGVYEQAKAVKDFVDTLPGSGFIGNLSYGIFISKVKSYFFTGVAQLGLEQIGGYLNAENYVGASLTIFAVRAVLARLLAKQQFILSKVMAVMRFVSKLSMFGDYGQLLARPGGTFRLIFSLLSDILSGVIQLVSYPAAGFGEENEPLRQDFVKRYGKLPRFVDGIGDLAGAAGGMISWSLHFSHFMYEIYLFTSGLGAVVVMSPFAIAGVSAGAVVGGVVLYKLMRERYFGGLVSMRNFFGRVLCTHPEFPLLALKMLRLTITGRSSTVFWGTPDENELSAVQQRINAAGAGFTNAIVVKPERAVGMSAEDADYNTQKDQFLQEIYTAGLAERAYKLQGLVQNALNNSKFKPKLDDIQSILDSAYYQEN